MPVASDLSCNTPWNTPVNNVWVTKDVLICLWSISYYLRVSGWDLKNCIFKSSLASMMSKQGWKTQTYIRKACVGPLWKWSSVLGFVIWKNRFSACFILTLHLLLLYWLCQSLWLCVSQQTGKFLKRWEYWTTWPVSWEIWMQVKKQQLELDMEQPTGSKLGKEYVKTVCCHLAHLTYMQSTSCEMPGWMKHRLESRLGEISITSDMQMTPPLWQKVKKN